ncbi:MAG: type II toxin-antitoxin system ParD family antitoxin [Woeseiaceae bacterium]|jgi:antitoxin ParD1/3/4|nr:type II toxin-antitoxin system ParD family antitoxin [Woeseiaceae bacterium]
MATTSLSLGGHWEEFIKQEIKSGRYSTASEVVRDALRELEDRGKRLEALRAHLAEGAGQAARKDFVKGYDIESVIERTKDRA